MRFDRASLEANGFTGWMTFPQTAAKGVIPTTGGVYVVTYSSRAPVTFLRQNPARWRDNIDPTVSLAALEANWIDAEVIYIGKADKLRRRINQFRRYGEGRATNHQGGRLFWQLAEPDQLRIAWKETPDRVPVEVEEEMLTAFRREYGKPPFANDPHLLGR